mmetsp:Transcript_25437/g.61518  ORF Transcript_25437/g.61518 Transcript_25437/m.61518 type:complete len:586 (-) Transcript_25437:46-1803(-)
MKLLAVFTAVAVAQAGPRSSRLRGQVALDQEAEDEAQQVERSPRDEEQAMQVAEDDTEGMEGVTDEVQHILDASSGESEDPDERADEVANDVDAPEPVAAEQAPIGEVAATDMADAEGSAERGEGFSYKVPSFSKQFAEYYQSAFGVGKKAAKYPGVPPSMSESDLPKLFQPYLTSTRVEKFAVSKLLDGMITQTVMEEQPKIADHMKYNAARVARLAAAEASKKAAKDAISQGYTTTSRLLVNEARRACHSLSNLPQFPGLCGRRAEAMFAKLREGALNRWSHAVQSKALKAATSRATHDAVRAVVGLDAARLPPLAYSTAQKVFNSEWTRFQKLYEIQAQKDLAELVKKKSDWWYAAQKKILNNVHKAVRTALWTQPVLEAEQKSTQAATIAATRISNAVATQHLGPRFIRAAQVVLPSAIRESDGIAMKSWNVDSHLNPDSPLVSPDLLNPVVPKNFTNATNPFTSGKIFSLNNDKAGFKLPPLPTTTVAPPKWRGDKLVNGAKLFSDADGVQLVADPAMDSGDTAAPAEEDQQGGEQSGDLTIPQDITDEPQEPPQPPQQEQQEDGPDQAAEQALSMATTE